MHQIDISQKVSTRRRATATANVVFSNSSVVPLIQQHALQKGDVLAVARIAGIEAVKKTAEIIPLAHSGLAIESILVDLQFESHAKERAPIEHVNALQAGRTTERNSNLGASAPSGRIPVTKQRLSSLFRDSLEEVGEEAPQQDSSSPGIRITVEVTTTGKTGVEMEALTGVMGAALSIVDMCKAVDRHIRIDGVTILGKEGGKSGAWGVYDSGERTKRVGVVPTRR